MSTPHEQNLKFGANVFDRLNSDSTDKNNQQTPAKKIRRPSPVIVTGICNNLKELLAQQNINNYNVKMISIGTKIFIENDEDFNQICSLLKDKSIEFFTHSSKNEKLLKVVLTGLPDMDIESIKDELKMLNITPSQIFKMTVRNPNPNAALYLLHLNSKETSLQDLNKVKALCHTIVKWNKYKPKFRGPTQCRNCAMYGHGTQNCHRKPSCSLCASNEHSQANCQLKNLSTDVNPVFKCAYCIKNNFTPVNHRANDPVCPGRKAYVDSRKSLVTRKQNSSSGANANRNNNKIYIDAPAPAPLTQSYSSIVSKQNIEVNNVQEDDADNNSSENLFSTAELFQIFTKAIGQFRNCKTKLD